MVRVSGGSQRGGGAMEDRFYFSCPQLLFSLSHPLKLCQAVSVGIRAQSVIKKSCLI